MTKPSPIVSERKLTVGKVAARTSQLFNLSTLRGTPVPAERKYQAYKLCQRIAANPREVELTTEDCSLLKEVASETYSAGAYGQVVDLIEANV